MPKKRPALNAPFLLDFLLEEQALNVNWFDGRPIFRQAFQMVGGNGTSTVVTSIPLWTILT